jgi:hypothetical protein
MAKVEKIFIGGWRLAVFSCGLWVVGCWLAVEPESRRFIAARGKYCFRTESRRFIAARGVISDQLQKLGHCAFLINILTFTFCIQY